MFEMIISLSPFDQNGYFTLQMMDSYLRDKEIVDYSHFEFFNAMSYFLNRKNHKIYLDRKRKTRT